MVIPYGDIAMSAASYSLECGILSAKKPNPKGNQLCRESLVELGRRLKGYMDLASEKGHVPDEVGVYHSKKSGEKYDPSNTLIGSLEGLNVAFIVEDEHLKNEGSNASKRLRQLGVTSLDELANVLTSAQNLEEFDRFAQPLYDFFDEWRAIAEELSVIGYWGDIVFEVHNGCAERQTAA